MIVESEKRFVWTNCSQASSRTQLRWSLLTGWLQSNISCLHDFSIFQQKRSALGTATDSLSTHSMCTSIESAVCCGDPRELTAHGARETLFEVKGLPQLDVGRGPVKALTPVTNAEHTMADFIMMSSLRTLSGTAVSGRGLVRCPARWTMTEHEMQPLGVHYQVQCLVLLQPSLPNSWSYPLGTQRTV